MLVIRTAPKDAKGIKLPWERTGRFWFPEVPKQVRLPSVTTVSGAPRAAAPSAPKAAEESAPKATEAGEEAKTAKERERL